jgi:hypothetical protein
VKKLNVYAFCSVTLLAVRGHHKIKEISFCFFIVVCKPRELDEIITSEHSLLQKLRASGLSDSELLEMVGITVADNSNSEADDNSRSVSGENADSSSESNSVSEKHGNDHRNSYAVSEELEGQMSFGDN